MYVCFLDLPLGFGISQREFRARVPAAWRQLPIYPGYIHNQNLRGEIRPGYFEYRFVARGAEYPRTEFNFWEGKLVDALFISNGDNTEKRAHRAAAVRAAKILTRRYGRSEDSDMYRDLIWVHWRRGDVLARVSWHGRLTPNFSTYRSEFGISWEIYPKSMDWSGWRNRMPDTEGESETMAWITCQRKPEIPGDFSIQPGAFVFMPGLSEGHKRRVAMQKALLMSRKGLHCNGMIVEGSSSEMPYRRKRRQPNTYLYYTDLQGLVTIEWYSYDVRTEDRLCLEALNRLIGTEREGAECVTGTDVWVKP